MLAAIIRWSLDNRLVVLILAGALTLSGVWSFLHLPVDALPDTSPLQVQVNTVAPSLSPEEVERQITAPIEMALSGLPGLEMIRSLSKFGFSQVITIFEEHADIHVCRQVVNERLQSVELPEGIQRPELGPITTGLGEVFHYLVTSPTRELADLRTLHDWIVKPILASTPGVSEVNAWGGAVKQYQVRLDPAKLLEFGLDLDDLERALRASNANVGGGGVTQAGEQLLVHGIGVLESVNDIENVVLSAHEGVPIRVRDVARVVEGHEIRRGAVTALGEREVVLGLAFTLRGENTREVTRKLETKLAEAQRALPSDVTLDAVYNRIDLVASVLRTVRTNLIEGALFVIAFLFLLMGNFRAGIITALSIPLSMLFAFNAMRLFGIEGSLMSLGAIDFGIVVDSSIIIVENTVRRIAERRGEKDFVGLVRDACIEVRRPTTFGEAVIAIVYLPILTLHGIEGKLFQPMALTFLFCLLGSFILSLTLMPVLASLLLPRTIRHKQNGFMRPCTALYDPILRLSLRVRWAVLVLSFALLGATAAIALDLGTEFVPRFSEGAIIANTVRLAGVSLEESARYGMRIEKVVLESFPDEIDKVWTRTGTAEVATDPMGLEVSDLFMTLHPREKWKRANTQAELTEMLSKKLSTLPGMRVAFTQPIEMRMNEMTAGARTDVVVKVYGDDLARLETLAREVEAVMIRVPGNAEPRVDQVTGLPVLQVRLNREALARHGLHGDGALNMVEAMAGRKVGEIREENRRFDLVARLDEAYWKDISTLENLVVPSSAGVALPLRELADITYAEGPATVFREWGRRAVGVHCNVRGRDVGSFVRELEERLRAEVRLPTGWHFEIGGQFEHMVSARRRLYVAAPLALALIFMLLYLTYNSMRDALIVSSKIPFAAVGGVLALHWRGMPFSISAAIGFIALFGIAILNGLVVVSSAKRLMLGGVGLQQAVFESALSRLRPVLATAFTDVAGFVPMALSQGMGAEVQRPLATVVIGGIVSSTLLTLVVLPVLYSLFGRPPEEMADSDWV